VRLICRFKSCPDYTELNNLKINNMLKIKNRPNYFLIVTPGVYDGHEFNILDTDKGLYIMFKDYYEKDPQSFNDIQEEIKSQYLRTRVSGLDVGCMFDSGDGQDIFYEEFIDYNDK
jgi:hypothetical protein